MYIHESCHKYWKVATSRIIAAPLVAALTLALIINFLSMRNLFVILDSGSMVLYTTYERDVHDALAEAGISISNTDFISMPSLHASGGYSEILIQRSAYVTVEADGRTNRLITYGESVSAILDRIGVKLRASDSVEPDLGTPSYDGMHIIVTRNETKLVYESSPIPFEEVIQANRKMVRGTENVIQEGSDGEMQSIYQVVYENGKEVSKELITEFVLKAPVEKIIEVGSAGTITVGGKTYTYNKMLEVSATAYSAEGRENARTASGTLARVGAIAVDPKVIPLGTKVYIESTNGTWIYGIASCEDTGGAIKGNIIDLYFNTYAECFAFGRRKAHVYILD